MCDGLQMASEVSSHRCRKAESAMTATGLPTMPICRIGRPRPSGPRESGGLFVHHTEVNHEQHDKLFEPGAGHDVAIEGEQSA
jgi:hypothetical protein